MSLRTERSSDGLTSAPLFSLSPGTVLSASSLQTLSLMNKRSAQDFRKFVTVVACLGHYPHSDADDPQEIDLSALEDLGLIRDQIRQGPYRVREFTFAAEAANLGSLNSVHAVVALTRRGSEIARAVFRNDAWLLSEQIEQAYLQCILLSESGPKKREFAVHLSSNDIQHVMHFGQSAPIASDDWRKYKEASGFPKYVLQLLDWAQGSWKIQIARKA